MSTLSDKVKQYTGTLISSYDETAISVWLTAGARQVIDLLPKEKLMRVSTTQNFTTSLAITFKRMLNLLVNSQPPRQVDYSLSGKVLNAASMYAATATDPVFWISGGMLYVAPVSNSGIIEYVAYPQVQSTDTYIAQFPFELEQLIIQYAAIQVLISAAVQSTVALTGLTIPTFSSTLPAPSFTYTNATLGTYVNGLIGDFGTPPAWTLAISDNTSFSFAGITVPTVPSIPAFTMPFVTSGMPILDLTTEYTNLETALTNDDIDLANGYANDIQTRIQEWNTDVSVYLKSSESQSNLTLQKEMQEYQAKIAQYSDQIDTVKLAMAVQVEAYNLNMQNYSANVQKSVSIAAKALEADNIEYQANIQKAIQQAGMVQQALLKLAEDTSNINLANDAKQLEQQIQQYSAVLQKYQAELGYYSGKIQLFNAEVGQLQSVYTEITKTIELLTSQYNSALGVK